MLPMQCLENNHYFNVTALQQNGDDGLQVNDKIDNVTTTSFSTIVFYSHCILDFALNLLWRASAGLDRPREVLLVRPCGDQRAK